MKNLIALIVLIMAAASFSTKKEIVPIIIKCQLNQQGKHIKVVCPKVENNRKPAYIVW